MHVYKTILFAKSGKPIRGKWHATSKDARRWAEIEMRGGHNAYSITKVGRDEFLEHVNSRRSILAGVDTL